MKLVLLPRAGLAPVHAALEALGPAPTADAIGAIAVADRWMGDGARLIEAGGRLAAALRAAWDRAGHPGGAVEARRVIAGRQLYGIDPERAAVTAARRAITAWAGHPPVFVDHAIRRGDARWIFTPAQLAAFDVAADARPRAALADRLAAGHAAHRARRAAVLSLALADPGAASAALERADAAVDVPRVIGDVLAGCIDDAGRPDNAERLRRQALVERWLGAADARAEAELRALQAALRRARATFHWMTEFSELYPDAPTGAP